MTLPDGVRTAGRMLRAHSLRSILALLGLSVGVAALVTTLALGAGAEALVTAQLRAVGSDILIVLSGSATSAGMRLGLGTRLTITQDDAAAIEREIPSVEHISGMEGLGSANRRRSRLFKVYLMTRSIVQKSPAEWLSFTLRDRKKVVE